MSRWSLYGAPRKLAAENNSTAFLMHRCQDLAIWRRLADGRGPSDPLSDLTEVGFSERLDTVVMSPGPAHHGRPLPVPDGALHQLRTWSVQSVEGAGRNLAIKLSAVSSQAVTPSVEHLDRPSGLLGVFAMIGGAAGISSLGVRALPRNVTRDFAAAGGTADGDGVAEVMATRG